jgi:hypothetical protein
VRVLVIMRRAGNNADRFDGSRSSVAQLGTRLKTALSKRQHARPIPRGSAPPSGQRGDKTFGHFESDPVSSGVIWTMGMRNAGNNDESAAYNKECW